MKNKSKIILSDSYPWRGLMFNIFAVIYFLLLAPLIEKISLQKFTGEKAFFPVIGLILIVLSAMEVYAFPKKINLIKKLFKDTKEEIGDSTMILWIFHLTISVVALLIILSSFGYNIDNKTNTPFLIIFLIFMVIIKEIYFLMIIIDDNTISKNTYRKLKEKEWIYDIVLVVYSWFAFSIMWTAVSKTGDNDMHRENTGIYILNLIIVSFIFLIMYLPVRIPYLLEEKIKLNTTSDYIKFAASILMVLIAALININPHYS
jgi:MFS family permease